MIEKVSISNFKSIKHVEFKAKRINLLIGEPNVGKSNILEALSILSIRDLLIDGFDKKIDFIRFEKLWDIFNDIREPARIIFQKKNFGMLGCEIKFQDEELYFDFDDLKFSLSNDKAPSVITNGIKDIFTSAMLYKYSIKERFTSKAIPYHLSYPYGENLFETIFFHSQLLEEFLNLIEPFGFEAFISEDESELIMYKKLDRFKRKILSFNLLADTFKRFLFHFAAINTNAEQTLLFEEPEANSFPTYISRLAQEIVDSSNQFFIVTHSPYLYDQLISTVPKEEINILKVGFEDYSTTVKEIAYKDYAELNKLGVDVFFNLDNL